MRILHVETINGVAHSYAAGLARHGHTARFYEPSLAGAGGSLAVRLAHMPGRMLDLRRGVRLLRPDVCDLAHIQWATYGVLGLAGRVPYIVQCHGRDVGWRVHDWRFRPALHVVLQHAAAVLCITPDLLDPVRSIRPDAQLLPAAIDSEYFAPCPPAIARPWTVLLFARLDAIKGTPIAVAALERFAARHPAARVLLLDYGPLSAEYQRRFGGRFTFVPQVVPTAVPDLLAGADVVVGQFFLGALGLSELQAMSCAKPVIVAHHYDAAYDAPPPVRKADTSDEIEAHLEAFFADPESALRLGEQARAWICAYHDQEAITPRLERIYAAALDRA